MNKFLSKLFLLMAVALVIPAFTSCGDDDKKGDDTDYAEGIVGTYNGEMTGKAMSAKGTLEDIAKISGVDITVAYKSKNEATLTLNEEIPTDMGLVIPLNVTCPVTTSGGNNNTKIAGTVTVDIPNSPMPALSSLKVNIDGTIDSKGVAVINIKDTMGGAMVTITFNGKLVTAE